MVSITRNTVPQEVDALKPYAPYLMFRPLARDETPVYQSIEQMCKDCPTWPLESMIVGVRRAAELAEQGPILCDVYSPQEIAEDESRRDVKVWFFPAQTQPSDKPFVLCYAGGAYQVVCSDVEAFPVAARLNELGYNVFVPTYRVGLPDLMPKPLEDVAATLRFILANKRQFGLTTEQYIVNGYSAGANLTCLWGLQAHGYAHYDLPKPLALMPIYPVTAWQTFVPEACAFFQSVMFGKNNTPETLAAYNVIDHVDAAYTPCYLVHAKDDGTVPYQNSVLLKEKLDAFGIPAVLELVERGDHGFGDGRGTPAEGWVDRAAAFTETL